MRLFRPVGLFELRALVAAEFSVFPEQSWLAQQAYASYSPGVDLEFARQIARDWIATDERAGCVGFVTQFDLKDVFMAGIAVQSAGPTCHREIWIPPEREGEFNLHIQGPIRVIETFIGARFEGDIERVTGLSLDRLGSIDG